MKRKVFLTIVAMSLTSAVLIIVGKSSYLNRVNIRPIIITRLENTILTKNTGKLAHKPNMMTTTQSSMKRFNGQIINVMSNNVDLLALELNMTADKSSMKRIRSHIIATPEDIAAPEPYVTLDRTKSNTKRSKKQSTLEHLLNKPALNKPKVAKSHEKCVKRLPQAIIVGIQKSGTTALLRFLSEHPQIAACLHPIETQYFSGKYHKPLSWYKNLMPCSYSNQITIEKDPPYFYRAYCPNRIRKMNPKTKIILIVKDPITRALSMYAMVKEHNLHLKTSFEDSVSFNRQQMVDGHSKYIDFSNYPKYMRAWVQNFKHEQILVVDGHNLEKDPSQELNRVETFLGIDTYFTKDRFTFNDTKGKYCVKSGKSDMDCLNDNKGRDHPTINKKMRAMLERYFRPKNKQFFKMIHGTLDWGY